MPSIDMEVAIAQAYADKANLELEQLKERARMAAMSPMEKHMDRVAKEMRAVSERLASTDFDLDFTPFDKIAVRLNRSHDRATAKVQDGSTFFKGQASFTGGPRGLFDPTSFMHGHVEERLEDEGAQSSNQRIHDLNHAGRLVHEIRQRVNFEETIDNANMLPQMTFMDDVTIRLNQCNTGETVATTFDTPKEAIAAARLLLAFLGPKPVVQAYKPADASDQDFSADTDREVTDDMKAAEDYVADDEAKYAESPEKPGRVEIVVYVDDNRVAEITDLQGLIQLGTVHAPRIAAEIERMTAAMEIATGRR